MIAQKLQKKSRKKTKQLQQQKMTFQLKWTRGALHGL